VTLKWLEINLLFFFYFQGDINFRDLGLMSLSYSNFLTIFKVTVKLQYFNYIKTYMFNVYKIKNSMKERIFLYAKTNISNTCDTNLQKWQRNLVIEKIKTDNFTSAFV